MGTRILDKGIDGRKSRLALVSQGLAVPVQLIFNAGEPFACNERLDTSIVIKVG